MQLTLRQVAVFFQVSENMVRQWVKDGNLPAHDINSQYRFDRAELLEWAAIHHRSFSPAIFQELNGDRVAQRSLADAMERGGVVPCVGGGSRSETFRAAIGGLPLPPTLDRDALIDLLMAREKSSGTAVGHGIAIPHPRYPIVLPGGKSVIRTCYLKQALDELGSDGQPIDTLFLMFCPTVHEHLQLLARLACLLNADEFRQFLRTRPDANRLVATARDQELALAKTNGLPHA